MEMQSRPRHGLKRTAALQTLQNFLAPYPLVLIQTSSGFLVMLVSLIKYVQLHWMLLLIS